MLAKMWRIATSIALVLRLRRCKERVLLGNGRAQLFDVLEGRQLLTVNPPAAAGPWTAAYVDEFNSLNTSVWTNGRTWGNSDVTASGTFSPNNATVSNGALTLAPISKPIRLHPG